MTAVGRLPPDGAKKPEAADDESTQADCDVSVWKSIPSGQGESRTHDTRIFSPLLYYLSYLSVNALF